MTTGQILKIESSPDGEELFNLTVPAGKQWIEIDINLDIVEIPT